MTGIRREKNGDNAFGISKKKKPTKKQGLQISAKVVPSSLRTRPETSKNGLLTLVVLSGGVEGRGRVVRGEHLDVVDVLFLPVERHQGGDVAGVRVDGEKLAVVGQFVGDAVVGHGRVRVDGPHLHYGGAGGFVFQHGPGHHLGEHGHVVVDVFQLDVQLVFRRQVVFVLKAEQKKKKNNHLECRL